MQRKPTKSKLFLYYSLFSLGTLSVGRVEAEIKSESGETQTTELKLQEKNLTSVKKPLPTPPPRIAKPLPKLPDQIKKEEKPIDAESLKKWQKGVERVEAGEGVTIEHLEIKFSGFQKLMDTVFVLNKYNTSSAQKTYKKSLEIVLEMFTKYKEKAKKSGFKFDPVEWSAIIGGLSGQTISIINKIVEDLDQKVRRAPKKITSGTDFLGNYAVLLKMKSEIRKAFQITNEPVENRSARIDAFEKQYLKVLSLIK